MNGPQRVRWAVNLVNLSTPLGLLLALAGRASVVDRQQDGIHLYSGYRLPLPIASAFTVGNVILFRDVSELAGRPRLLAHETRHATQYAWCLGVVMLPLYLLGAVASLVLCGDPASYNPFERLAGLADGGYRQRGTWF